MAYKLPELGYDYGALEPHISGKILELHHSKHHAAYVNNANAALVKLADARAKNDFAAVPALERALAFNLSGHVLHAIYWRNMTPKGGDKPTGELAAAIDDSFGSFDAFRGQMTEASATTMGSGWGALAWEPMSKKLLVTQVYDHQSNLANGAVPLYVIDAWEHAFYLQYQNRKADYCKAIWAVANWDDVAQRFAAARKLDLLLPGSSD
ncbi:MAG: superoxide dismutase [Planctomycetes bacterium]|nr:superoxide dismutase [Planctomycetota bacterium]